MGTRRLTGLGIVGGLALVALVAVVLLLLRAGQIEHGPIRPAEATRVADVARAAVAPVAVGEATRVAVLAAPGVGLTGALPPATATPTPEDVLVGEGTPAPDIRAVVEDTPAPRAVSDPMRGIAAVIVDRASAGRPVALGRSDTLKPGDQLILATGSGEPLVVRFAATTTFRLGPSILAQYVLDLELPDDRSVVQGAVLDRQGLLVGVVVPERQSGAPPGHVYAVPVEQAAEILKRIGAAAG